MLFSKRLERIAGLPPDLLERQEATPDEGLRCYRWDQYGALESRSRAIIWLTIFSFGGGWVGLVSNSQSLASAASRSFLSGLGLRYELFPKEAQNACLIFSSESQAGARIRGRRTISHDTLSPLTRVPQKSSRPLYVPMGLKTGWRRNKLKPAYSLGETPFLPPL